MDKKIIFTGLGIVALGAIITISLNQNKIVPSVNVADQAVRDGKVVIASATAVAPSWLVVQTETNGAPGPVIGYIRIEKGENKDVNVKIDTQKATPKLFAMIHEDSGQKGKFDFPDNDMPLVYKEEMVSKLFNIQ